MNIHTATELSFKNGHRKGKKDTIEKIRDELSKHTFTYFVDPDNNEYRKAVDCRMIDFILNSMMEEDGNEDVNTNQ